MSDLADQFERMIARLFPPAKVRAIDAGGTWEAERAEIEGSGFLDALATGLVLSEVVPLWSMLGRYAAPLGIGEAMIERGALPEDVRILLLAAAISGASDRVIDMTVAYANERSQFGKPIGRQQAIQQQIAVIAEDCVAVRLAVALAAQDPDPMRIACAKSIASAAAPRIANTAHAVHGAIGISAEYDLQLFTRRLHAWRLEGGSETHWNRQLGRAMLGANDDALGFVRRAIFGE